MSPNLYVRNWRCREVQVLLSQRNTILSSSVQLPPSPGICQGFFTPHWGCRFSTQQCCKHLKGWCHSPPSLYVWCLRVTLGQINGYWVDGHATGRVHSEADEHFSGLSQCRKSSERVTKPPIQSLDSWNMYWDISPIIHPDFFTWLFACHDYSALIAHWHCRGAAQTSESPVLLTCASARNWKIFYNLMR